MPSPAELKDLFAAQTEIPLSLLQGKPFGEGDFSFRADPYGFRAGPAYKPSDSLLSDLTHLWARESTRFSNSLTQLRNLFSLAWKYKVPNIVVPNFWYLDPGTQRVSDELTLINLHEGQEFVAQSSDLALMGRFFYRITLSDLYPKDNKSKVIGRIQHLFNLDMNQAALPEDNLVIHLRSGDIFRGNGAHVAYGQPPLAFYQKVIDRERPKKVFLVFEDMGNPVIIPLEEHVTRIGVEVETVSGSLKSDIEFLLRGAVLVAGRGSFMCAITALSRHARKVYYFDSLYNDWGKPGLEIIRAFDVESVYRDKVLTLWNNTAEQNELMLRYPLNHIAL